MERMYSGTAEGVEAAALAAGIFRGEGNVGCRLRRTPEGGYTPFLWASVQMCDKESVDIVAKEWDAVAYQSLPFCQKSASKSWRVTIGGNIKVRTKILAWIARGWLTGEKADDYFEAMAKFRMARRAFVKNKRLI